MRHVVSYTLFRSTSRGHIGEFYADRLPTLVRAHHLIWPGWELNIHHDDAITNHTYWRSMQRLQEAGLVRLTPCGPVNKGMCLAMLWRLKPIWDEDVAVVACRDVDSVTYNMDRLAVEEFLSSGKTLHTIHGAPPHGGLMGGTTSFRAPEFRAKMDCATWQDLIDLGHEFDWGIYGQDQDFMTLKLLPKMREATMVHCFGEGPLTGLPEPSENRGAPTTNIDWKYPDAVQHAMFSEYVGMVYNREGAKEFYTQLDCDPVFKKIRECE